MRWNGPISQKSTNYQNSLNMTDNLNSSVTIKDTISSLKTTKNKISRTRWFPWKILPNVYRKINTNSIQSPSENGRGQNTSQDILWGLYDPDNKTGQSYN